MNKVDEWKIEEGGDDRKSSESGLMAVNLFSFSLFVSILFCDSVSTIASQPFEVLRKQRYCVYGYSTTVLGYTSTVQYSFLVRQEGTTT